MAIYVYLQVRVLLPLVMCFTRLVAANQAQIFWSDRQTDRISTKRKKNIKRAFPLCALLTKGF
jgi:hypothetical protein